MTPQSSAQFRDAGLLLLRIGLGASFMVHGWPKLMGGPHGWHELGGAMGNLGIDFAPAFWGFTGAVIEFFGGLMLVVGLLFRPVCLLLAVQMVVAITFHLHVAIPTNPMAQGILRAFATGWSHALEDGVVFLALALIGPGRLSVDERCCSGPRTPQAAPPAGSPNLFP